MRMIYAYIRKNYPEPVELQIKKIGKFNYEKLFIEGSDTTHHSELTNLIEVAKKNDTILICDLRVLSVTTKRMKDIFIELQEKGTHLISINDQINTTISKYFFQNIISVLLSEEEHRKYLVKINIEKARLSGRIGGRPAIDNKTLEKIYHLYHSKKLTLREVAELCDVSLGTVHKYIKIESEKTQ